MISLFAGVAAEIADAEELAVRADSADLACEGDLIFTYLVEEQFPGVRVAKDHIARAGAAAEIANTRELAVQADRQGASKGVGDPIVFYIVDQELGPILAGTGVAQHYVGFAGLAAEIADAEELPVQADVAHEGPARKFLVADVVDFEAAGGVPQQHLASRVIVETAERDKLPIGSDLAKLRAGGARITSEAVDLIQTIRSPTQHHDGGGA